MKIARLDGLDALRGIAALCVLAYHAVEDVGSNAYLAVDFFFMLSGYVMARTYESRLEGGMLATRFVGARLRRIWPTIFLGSLLSLPWMFSEMPAQAILPAIAANLLLLPYPLYNRMFVLNGPVWSIFFELFANLVHALLLWRLSARILSLVVPPLAVLLAYYASQYTLNVGSATAGFLAGFPRVLLSYCIGILLWRKWRDAPSVKASAGFTLLAMPLFFGLSTLVAGQSWQADMLFVLAVCPLLIAGGLQLERVHPLLIWLGSISFPLYAVHVPAMRLMHWLGVERLWGVVACIPLAWALMHIAAAVHAFDFARLVQRRRGALAKA
ncbi:MAG: acyltransferase [Novosphingobium sp.]|nr:acyltransferase [Novosphingobium sp.]